MIAQVSDWLPDGALAAPAFLQTIDARIDAWSARWFGDRTIRRHEPPAMPTAVMATPAPRHGWRRFGPGIWLDWSEQTPRGLALHALGRADLHPRLTADDERLLDLLGERVARDLAASLFKAPAHVPADPHGGPARAVGIKLCSASHAVGLAVALDGGSLAALCKLQCPPWHPREAEPQALAKALGDVSIAFEVALGSVPIGLLEFGELEAGDTVVLDQRIGAPLVLRTVATGTAIGQAVLVHEHGKLTLTAS